MLQVSTVIMAFIQFGSEIEYIREKSWLNKNLKVTLEFVMTVSRSKSYSIRLKGHLERARKEMAVAQFKVQWIVDL
jgi:hypothetical protein